MNASLTDIPSPAAPTAQEIGAQMARLREQFGLTPQEVSERLHIRARYITAMEEGRYELMPGSVYARGYVHSYAEFLGMDADQAVAQCFAGEASVQVQAVPVASRHGVQAFPRPAGRGKAYVVTAVLGLGALLLLSQLGGWLKHKEPAVVAVAPVPEAMLASVRTLVMPTPNNYHCLAAKHYLGCFYADPATHRLVAVMRDSLLQAEDVVPFVSWMVAPDFVEDVPPTAVAEGEGENTAVEPSND